MSDPGTIGAALGAVALAVGVVALALGVLATARGAPSHLQTVADRALRASTLAVEQVDGLRAEVTVVLESVETEREEVRRQRRRLSSSESKQLAAPNGVTAAPDPNDREAYAAWIMATRGGGGIGQLGR